VAKKLKPKKRSSKTAARLTRPKREKKTVRRRERAPEPAATAESMAAQQRSISISEFFAKNRHLLGFDNPRKALLTAVKEAVDNSLDACEEARILPDLLVEITALQQDKFTVTVTDNGPGIVRKQIPNIFARLLYGSKFHRLKMSRGQQGIGISAAGMYGLLTTGQPVEIVSRTSSSKKAQLYHVQIDTAKNKPRISVDQECDFELPTGTRVTITLKGKHQKGRQSVDEYIAQTAMANPHAGIVYKSSNGATVEYQRQAKELPPTGRQIRPHPYGVELGLLLRMAHDSRLKQLSAFLRKDFSRVSARLARTICQKAKLSIRLKPSKLTVHQAEALHAAINKTKIMAPATDCIAAIGAERLEEGLKAVVKADFYTATSRSPSVYSGNPFLIEAALAYGIKDGNGGDPEREPVMRLIRIANRAPLLYQQSACAIYRSVVDVNWRNYSVTQNRGSLPNGPMALMVNMASVWVPFTSESKEAIAHYPEIIREIQLAVQDCGRKLGAYLRRKKRVQQEMEKRRYIETYLPYIGEALQDILSLKQHDVILVTSRLQELLEKTRRI